MKGGNVNLEDFPTDFDSMSPERQVSAIAHRLTNYLPISTLSFSSYIDMHC